MEILGMLLWEEDQEEEEDGTVEGKLQHLVDRRTIEVEPIHLSTNRMKKISVDLGDNLEVQEFLLTNSCNNNTTCTKDNNMYHHHHLDLMEGILRDL